MRILKCSKRINYFSCEPPVKLFHCSTGSLCHEALFNSMVFHHINSEVFRLPVSWLNIFWAYMTKYGKLKNMACFTTYNLRSLPYKLSLNQKGYVRLVFQFLFCSLRALEKSPLPPWSSGYGTRPPIRRSQDRTPAAAAALRWRPAYCATSVRVGESRMVEISWALHYTASLMIMSGFAM